VTISAHREGRTTPSLDRAALPRRPAERRKRTDVLGLGIITSAIIRPRGDIADHPEPTWIVMRSSREGGGCLLAAGCFAI
jgi:hypothetical protein